MEYSVCCSFEDRSLRLVASDDRKSGFVLRQTRLPLAGESGRDCTGDFCPPMTGQPRVSISASGCSTNCPSLTRTTAQWALALALPDPPLVPTQLDHGPWPQTSRLPDLPQHGLRLQGTFGSTRAWTSIGLSLLPHLPKHGSRPDPHELAPASPGYPSEPFPCTHPDVVSGRAQAPPSPQTPFARPSPPDLSPGPLPQTLSPGPLPLC